MQFRTYNPIVGCLGKMCSGTEALVLGSIEHDADREHALDMNPPYDLKPPTTAELKELAKPIPGEPESALPAVAKPTTTTVKTPIKPPTSPPAKTNWGTILMWTAILGGGGYAIYHFGFRKKKK